MTVKQRRFGISINEELYEVIENLSKLYGMPRSKVIELLLENNLNIAKMVLNENLEVLVQLTITTKASHLQKLFSMLSKECYSTINVLKDPFSEELVFVTCYLKGFSKKVNSLIEELKSMKQVTYLINVLKVKKPTG